MKFKKKKVKGKVMYSGGKKPAKPSYIPPTLRMMEKPKPLPEQPITDPVIQFKLDQERDEEIQRKKDLETGRLIYEEWKHRFINRRKTVAQLADAVNELAQEIDSRIVSKWKDYVLNSILNPTIAHLHDQAVLEEFTTKALVDCPGTTMKNGIETECDWGGIAAFHIMIWEKGTAEMNCPECGRRLTQEKDMMLESESRKAFDKLTKRGGK